MKTFKSTISLLTAILFVPFAFNHPAVAFLLAITCSGFYLDAAVVLKECRMGTSDITISAFAENIFKARDMVARELVGCISSIIINADDTPVSINGTVTSLRTAQPTLNTSFTPSMTIPEGDAQTIAADTVQIGQTANVKIPMQGEGWLKLQNTAGGQQTLTDMFAQALRTMVNAIEVHTAKVMALGSSRATGTAGTTPFASDFKPVNQARQILVDNGCPTDGQLSLVLNTLAGTNLRNLSNLQKVNEAGGDDLLRRGTLLDLSGLHLKESAGIYTSTAGTMASATSTNAAFTVGQTVIPLATAGTGLVAAGDIVTFANDTNNYVVSAVSIAGANPASGDTITLALPGLRKAQSAATRAITVVASNTANLAFHRSSAELIMRPPAMPMGKDAAVDRMTLFDPVSGLVFTIALYLGYGKIMWDITSFYQAKVWKPDFIATLMG